MASEREKQYIRCDTVVSIRISSQVVEAGGDLIIKITAGYLHHKS